MLAIPSCFSIDAWRLFLKILSLVIIITSDLDYVKIKVTPHHGGEGVVIPTYF